MRVTLNNVIDLNPEELSDHEFISWHKIIKDNADKNEDCKIMLSEFDQECQTRKELFNELDLN